MRRTDRLLWTPYLGICLEDLSTTNVSRDLTLVSMVKTRQVLERAFYSPPSSHTSDPEIPADFVAAMLHTELDKLCASPAENPIISCHITYASFAISEFALTLASPDPQHLHKTYQALESYFKIFLAFQPNKYHGFTLAELYQLMHATLSTRKLVSQLTTGAYDERRVGRLQSWYQQVRNNLNDASTSPGAKADGRAVVFSKLAGMLETFSGGEIGASRHSADDCFDMDGVSSDMVPGEDWLEVMDQFGWTF
ncbi:hypothetical protein CGCSCA1_v002224 [Colletotrichum siamense]|nr:hypothetical protein CGCSCA1_v002224 [Colletotrichum siamense]